MGSNTGYLLKSFLLYWKESISKQRVQPSKPLPSKGQLIMKWFIFSSITSKKWTSEFDFTTMMPQVDLFSFVFWRKSTTPKNHFKIKWPLMVLLTIPFNDLPWFSPRQWLQTATTVTIMCLTLGAAWALIQLYSQPWIRMLAVSIGLLIQYICLR